MRKTQQSKVGRDMLKQLLDEGKTVRQICTYFGVNYRTVYYRIHAEGFDLPRGKAILDLRNNNSRQNMGVFVGGMGDLSTESLAYLTKRVAKGRLTVWGEVDSIIKEHLEIDRMAVEAQKQFEYEIQIAGTTPNEILNDLTFKECK